MPPNRYDVAESTVGSEGRGNQLGEFVGLGDAAGFHAERPGQGDEIHGRLIQNEARGGRLCDTGKVEDIATDLENLVPGVTGMPYRAAVQSPWMP